MRVWKSFLLLKGAAAAVGVVVVGCAQPVLSAPFLLTTQINSNGNHGRQQLDPSASSSSSSSLDPRLNSHDSLAVVGSPPPLPGPPSFLNGIILVSTGNILLNWLRPDPAIAWETRVPRILWESFLFCSAATLKAHPDAPLSYLLLSLMLGTTALIDIFFWAPVFGFWAGFDKEDCTGGWFTGKPYVCKTNHIKGYGRLFVTLQCLYAGAFYLNSAICSWNEYSTSRDRIKAQQQAKVFQHYLQQQQQQQQQQR